MSKILTALRGHMQEHVAKYATGAVAVLTPLAGLLGSVAADLGGNDTKAGQTALGGVAALGVAIAGVQYIRNLGIWQMLDAFGTAPGASHIFSRPDTDGDTELPAELAARAADPDPGLDHVDLPDGHPDTR